MGKKNGQIGEEVKGNNTHSVTRCLFLLMIIFFIFFAIVAWRETKETKKISPPFPSFSGCLVDLSGRTVPTDRNKEEAVSNFNKFDLMGKILLKKKKKKKKIFVSFILWRSFYFFFSRGAAANRFIFWNFIFSDRKCFCFFFFFFFFFFRIDLNFERLFLSSCVNTKAMTTMTNIITTVVKECLFFFFLVIHCLRVVGTFLEIKFEFIFIFYLFFVIFLERVSA